MQLNDLADESRLDIEIDFRHAESSIDKAVARLQKTVDNDGRFHYIVLYIKELLKWKQEGFRKDCGKWQPKVVSWLTISLR